MTPAPFHADLAEGPAGGHAVWLRTADGVRIRMGVWPRGGRGTVLMFPGRTECVEKYGRPAAELAAMGLASVALDWRGQGLADRPLADPMVGHVARFADYQHDLRAALAATAPLGLPQPLFLLAHSMGGCIGLRSLIEGLAVKAAVFTGPMWGIPPNPAMVPVARAVSGAARLSRQGHRYAPGTGPATYLMTAPFEGNTLTTDREMWDWMRNQVARQPALALGGPSLHWASEAMAEGRWLARQPLPPVPSLVVAGRRERVVSPAAIRRLCARWPAARLMDLPGAEHEVLMEAPPLRAQAYAAIAAHFS